MGWGGKLLQVGILKRYLSQALKDEKTLTTQSEGQCVLNSKNSMGKGPGVRLHLRMGLMLDNSVIDQNFYFMY